MDNRSKMEKVIKDKKIVAENRIKDYQESSRKRLESIAEKKIQTSFIGAINQFEEFFGHLWGHNEYKLTPEQKSFLVLWQKARNNILTKGNDQIRALKKELTEYTISWDRHTVEFRKEEK